MAPVEVAYNLDDLSVVCSFCSWQCHWHLLPSHRLVEPVEAASDLDNLRLQELGDAPAMQATYELEVGQLHCFPMHCSIIAHQAVQAGQSPLSRLAEKAWLPCDKLQHVLHRSSAAQPSPAVPCLPQALMLTGMCLDLASLAARIRDQASLVEALLFGLLEATQWCGKEASAAAVPRPAWVHTCCPLAVTSPAAAVICTLRHANCVLPHQYTTQHLLCLSPLTPADPPARRAAGAGGPERARCRSPTGGHAGHEQPG